MARHVSVATAIEKDRIASSTPLLALLEIDILNSGGVLQETIRFVRNSENITHLGNVYTNAHFDFEIGDSTNEVPDISVWTLDYTRAVQKKVDQYEGGVGFRIRLKIINSARLDDPAEVDEEMNVLSTDVDGYRVSWKVGARNPLRQLFPRRLQFRDRCPWRYKGVECRYSGPLATCDFTLQGPNGCAAHDNTPNFGGFPSLKRA